MTDGWDDSAKAWIASQGTDGDFSHQHVLDAPMLDRVLAAMPKVILDLGPPAPIHALACLTFVPSQSAASTPKKATITNATKRKVLHRVIHFHQSELTDVNKPLHSRRTYKNRLLQLEHLLEPSIKSEKLLVIERIQPIQPNHWCEI